MSTPAEIYNQLPSIPECDKLFTDRGVMAQLFDIFADYQQFAVTLVHRHCALYPGEIMVARGLITQPTPEINTPKPSPSAWLATGDPFEYNADPATPALPDDLLKRFQEAVKDAGIPDYNGTGIPILGICCAPDASLSGKICVETTEGRTNIVQILPPGRKLPSGCYRTLWYVKPVQHGLGDPPTTSCWQEDGVWWCKPTPCTPPSALHELYNRLPYVEDADKIFSDRSVLPRLLLTFADHPGFALTLVYRHFTLDVGEIMVTRGNVTQPEKIPSDLVSHPEKPELDTSKLSPSAWLATGLGEPFEFTVDTTNPALRPLPEALMERFREAVKDAGIPCFNRTNLPILGICRAPTDLAPDEIQVELETTAEDRKSCIKVCSVMDKHIGRHFQTMWMWSRTFPVRVDTDSKK